MTDSELLEIAKEARELSYSPYSNFKVGAAVLSKKGKTYKGSNIENASYSLCMCAERNALYNALMNGEKIGDFEGLAIIADTDEPCSPCGSCRQVIIELMPKDAYIIMSNLHGKTLKVLVSELLPHSFSKEDLVK